MTDSHVTGLVGRRVGVYDIVEEVGRGGMGVVYRAHDRSLDRDVALKVLLPSVASDPEFEKRFVREARAAARLDHPNIVHVHTAGRFENVLFIAMQFVKGKTLTQFQSERQGKIDWKEAFGIARQAADALGAAHKAGLVHRDIKPTNIMVDDAGRVKIMDFGLMRSSLNPERITQSGVFFGTPEYASPEQCETSEVDGRADIYSLGAVLYEMLTGRVPHVAETPMALFKKITEEDPQEVTSLNPLVPKHVVEVVRKMLARNRDERYATCGALIADLDRVLSGHPSSAAMKTVVAARPGRGTSRGALAGLALTAAVLLAGLMWLLVTSVRGATPIDTPKTDRVGLVVFDFKNARGGADAQWYEIALSDMLISSLAQQPWLTVPTRDQLLWKVQDMALGDRVRDEHRRRLVTEFAAHAYVAGTYYVEGGRVRVTATVYRVSDNVPVFPTMKIERPESELFALVDEMAKAVSDGLKSMQAPAGGEQARAHGDAPLRSTAEVMLARAELGEDEKLPRRQRGRFAAQTPAPGAQLADKGAYAGGKDATRDELRKAAERKLEQAYLGATMDADAMRHWYESRRMLEKSGCDQDEVALLAVDLDQCWAVDDHAQLQRALENFQSCLKVVADAKKAGGCKVQRANVEWECAKCALQRAEPGECPCGQALMLKVKLETKKE
jgi:serine/threonine-protein kinase